MVDGLPSVSVDAALLGVAAWQEMGLLAEHFGVAGVRPLPHRRATPCPDNDKHKLKADVQRNYSDYPHARCPVLTVRVQTRDVR